MKTKIHPKWHENTNVKCACGNTFTTGSTLSEIEVEVCSSCHPFYTGQMKYVDTAGRVDAFKAKRAKAKGKVLSKKEKREQKRIKRIEKELNKPASLEEVRRQFKPKTKTSSKTKLKKSNKKEK